MKLPDRRFATWGLGLTGIAVLPLFAGFTTAGWELSEVLGLASTLMCLALCGAPVRPRESTPPVLISPSRHELVGWLAFAAAMLHVVAALASDRTVLEYLKPTSPLYQVAGIAALLLLLGLIVTSVGGIRRRLWRRHHNFQATHVAIGCALIVLLAVHVVTTGRYTGGGLRRAVFILTAAGGLAMLLRRGRGAPPAPQSLLSRRLVFGRHSMLIVGVIAAATLLLGALVVPRAGVALREPILARAQTLPLNFIHQKHTVVNCLVCHHNYVDGRGLDACVHCHRSGRADLKVGVEARFHDFCFNCHRNPPRQFVRHGPVSGCVSCHQITKPVPPPSI